MASTLTASREATAYLNFACGDSQTVATRVRSRSPLKLFATHATQPACWVYAATLGGGFVGGDRVELLIDVGEDARAVLTTQASTKVYRSLAPTAQTIGASVESGALLAIVPDPVVCFAHADFTQVQQYDLRADASLVVLDWLTSGRHATGERWAFSRYDNRIDVRRDGRAVLFDRIVLDGSLDPIPVRMGRFEVLLTAVITGPLVERSTAELWDSISRAPVDDRDMVVTASRLKDGGVLLRMAGTDVERVGSAIRRHLSFLWPLVGDDCWSRKW